MAPPVEVLTTRLHAMRLRGAQHVDGPLDVGARVEGRVGHRLAHVDLGGEVEDRVGLRLSDRLRDGVGVANVDVDESRPLLLGVREVVLLAGREVVDHRDRVAAGEQAVDQVRPDEAGAACH